MEGIERNFPWLEAGIGLGLGVLGTVMATKLLKGGVAHAAGLPTPDLGAASGLPEAEAELNMLIAQFDVIQPGAGRSIHDGALSAYRRIKNPAPTARLQTKINFLVYAIDGRHPGVAQEINQRAHVLNGLAPADSDPNLAWIYAQMRAIGESIRGLGARSMQRARSRMGSMAGTARPSGDLPQPSLDISGASAVYDPLNHDI